MQPSQTPGYNLRIIRTRRGSGKVGNGTSLWPCWPTRCWPSCAPAEKKLRSGQTPLQLQCIRRAPPDAGELPHRTIWKTLLDRKRLLGSKPQTLLPGSRQNSAHAIPPSSPARLGLQPIPPPAACFPLAIERMSTEPTTFYYLPVLPAPSASLYSGLPCR